jgi:hypothetical protein
MVPPGGRCEGVCGSVRNLPRARDASSKDGGAAAVEGRKIGPARNWGHITVLLSHVDAGWQAIDIVPGGCVRPR